jgi:hypothetical protein
MLALHKFQQSCWPNNHLGMSSQVVERGWSVPQLGCTAIANLTCRDEPSGYISDINGTLRTKGRVERISSARNEITQFIMASAQTNGTDHSMNGTNGHANGAPKLRRERLKNSGSIDHLKYVDVTPIIGREYPDAKITDILHAENSEQQLRDLAITICERGVVFFRAPQDDLTVDEQKQVTDLLGKLTGRPEENGLHVHPLYNDPNNIPMANGKTDPNM